MSAAAHAAPVLVHQSMRELVFSCVFFSGFIALGLLAFFRPRLVNAAHRRLLRVSLWPPRRMPRVSATQLMGVVFIAVGTFLLGFNILDYLR
jgi:hypothetical protein